MKLKFLMILAAAGLMTACSTGKGDMKTDTADAEIASEPYSGSIAGQWLIENIEMNDSVSLKPQTSESENQQTITFTDSAYNIQTNCNLMQGEYTQTGDSISFGMGLSTRMACPDMSVEMALTELLPQLSSISMDNDSTLRLSSANPSNFVLLKKMSATNE